MVPGQSPPVPGTQRWPISPVSPGACSVDSSAGLRHLLTYAPIQCSSQACAETLRWPPAPVVRSNTAPCWASDPTAGPLHQHLALLPLSAPISWLISSPPNVPPLPGMLFPSSAQVWLLLSPRGLGVPWTPPCPQRWETAHLILLNYPGNSRPSQH